MKIENKIKIFNIPDRVTCKICMGTYNRISNSHLKRHGTTPSLYLKKYPDAILTGTISLRKMSKKRKEWLQKHPEYKPTVLEKYDVREFLKDKQILKKLHKHNAAVQQLPYRIRQHKNQWNDIIYRNKMNDIAKRKMKNMWSDPKLRKTRIKAMLEPKKKRIKKNIPKIKKMIDEGYTKKEIAKRLDICYNTIYNWLKEKPCN